MKYERKRDSNRLGSMGTRTVLQVTDGKGNISRNGAHGCQDSLFGIDRVLVEDRQRNSFVVAMG